MKDTKDPEQVLEAFEKSFEQSNSHWYYHKFYLGDFRQSASDTMVDLDQCIRETIKGCKFKKKEEEGHKIDFLSCHSLLRGIFKNGRSLSRSWKWLNLMKEPAWSTRTMQLPLVVPTVLHHTTINNVCSWYSH